MTYPVAGTFGDLMGLNGDLMLIGWTFDGDLIGLQNVIQWIVNEI